MLYYMKIEKNIIVTVTTFTILITITKLFNIIGMNRRQMPMLQQPTMQQQPTTGGGICGGCCGGGEQPILMPQGPFPKGKSPKGKSPKAMANGQKKASNNTIKDNEESEPSVQEPLEDNDSKLEDVDNITSSGKNITWKFKSNDNKSRYIVKDTDTLEMEVKWKDQGWGNKKGRIYIEQGEKSKKSDLIAPNDETKQTLKFDVSEFDYDTPVIFSYVVGGGSGHELYINEAKVLNGLSFDKDESRRKQRRGSRFQPWLLFNGNCRKRLFGT